MNKKDIRELKKLVKELGNSSLRITYYHKREKAFRINNALKKIMELCLENLIIPY